MKKEVGQLIKHSGIYGLGAILSKSVGFLMIPVYTRYLVPADYGVLELLDLTIFFSGIFAMMGIGSAFFRFYVASNSPDDRKAVTSTALFTVTGISLFVLGLMQLLAGPLSTIAFGSPAFAPLVRIVAFTLFFSNLTEVPLAYLRAQQRTVLFVVIGLIRTVLGATMLIVAVAILRKGVEGVVYANLLYNALAGVSLFAALLARVGVKVTREKFDAMFRYGAPLIVQSLASFVLVFSDRFFLRHFASLSEVGIYSLGYKLAGIVALLVSGPFSMTWSWQQFELAKQENPQQQLARVQSYQLFVCVFVGLGISILARDLLRIMSPNAYWSAARIVPLIALSYVLANLRPVLHTGILVQQATHSLASISIVVAVANLALNYLLIPRYHAMGAALATVLSYTLSLILSYCVAQRLFPIRYEYARSSILLGLAAAAYLLSTLPELGLFQSITTNLVLLMLFLLVTVKLLEEDERNMFRQVAVSLARQFRGVLVRSG